MSEYKMQSTRPSSSYQWMYGDEGNRPGVSFGNVFEPTPKQSTPRRDNNGLATGNAFGHSTFGQAKPYMSLISRPVNHTTSSFINGPPNAPYMTARSPSPGKLFGTSPSKYSDVENSTIQRQRKELQSLITELKDRDRELNEMSDSHQKQLISWETDKRRVLFLEKQLPKLKANLLKRTEQVRDLKERLRIAEHNAHSKTKELETTQIHLQQASDKANISSHQVEELQDRNENMANSIQELSTSLGQSQAKEQELITTLKLKENELEDANAKVNDLSKRVKNMQSSLQESRKSESVLKTERDQWKEQYQAVSDEAQKLRADITNHYTNEDDYQAELSQVKQEFLATQKELFLAGEREKRKDQLIDLSKSKQERTDNELQGLRQVYERQQKELIYLQQQLQDQDVLDRINDLNTDDDMSELSLVLKPKIEQYDAASPELDRFNNIQECVKGDGSSDVSLSMHQRSLIHASYPTIRTVKHKSRDKQQSPSEDGRYVEPIFAKVDTDDASGDKLQALIDESRKMVVNLENYSNIPSPHSTPEKKDLRNRTTDESFSTPGEKRLLSFLSSHGDA